MASDAEVAMQAAFVMAGIGGLCGLGMLTSGLRKRRQDRYARASYTPIEAQVRKVEKRESTGLDDDNNPIDTTSYLVTYAYEVDGRSYTGRAAFRNPATVSVRIYYDRNRPETSTRQPPIDGGSLSSLVVSACLFAFAAIFLGAGLLAMRQIE
jgi:hypothetical protein